MAFINQLRPVSYHLDISKLNKRVEIKISSESDSRQASAVEKEVRKGFIAKEVLHSADRLGYDYSGIKKPKNEADHFAVRYTELVVPLVKAVQELTNENAQLKAEIEDSRRLENRLEALEEKEN